MESGRQLTSASDSLETMHWLVPPHVQRMANRGALQDSTTGAVLIIDAEGSTALSARLEPYGTAGAEAFSDILAAIFAPMVDRVVSEGGSVAELAGDGVLAVFGGGPKAAVARATSAAAGVLDDLQAMSEFESPDGPASLTVRAVVGAGTIESVIWSTGDREARQNAAYVSLGNALDEARRGEAVTPGGVVSVGPRAAAHLPNGTVGTELPGGFTAIRPVSGPQALLEPPTEPAKLPARMRFYPHEVVAADLRGEFRDVVAVFVDLARHDSGGMEHVLGSLSQHRGYLNTVAASGTDANALRALALWGAPTSREHDIGYALRFVEDLRVVHGGEMRAGVTRSTVFTGFIGSPHQEVYTAIGPGVNLASRICNEAGWGEIWVDPNITSRLSDPWRLENMGELEYRGFSNPIPTARVVYVPPVRTPGAIRGPIAGRSKELDQLEDALAPLWAGQPAGVIAVFGDPGIGKSRLISALEDRLSKRVPAPVWMRAQADEIRTQPLATLRDALAGYFGRPGLGESGERLDDYLEKLGEGRTKGADELSRTRSALGDLLNLPADVERAEKLDPKARFENLLMAVENLIEALERSSPVIISVADAHWMDNGTAEVLRRISSDLDGARLAIVVETRDIAMGIEPDRKVEVGPLDEANVAELAYQALGESASPELVSALFERSGGNPFFVQQLLEYQQTSVPVGVAGGLIEFADGAEVPLDMRRLLVARLDGLPAPVRRLVQTASILGRDISLRVLHQMSGGEPGFDQSVQEALDDGIWDQVDDGHIRFSSLLIRDAAYGMLLHSDARSLHAGAAAAIESDSEASERNDAELAYHHDRAGNSTVASGYYLGAGRQAGARYDNKQAHVYLDRALELIPSTDPTRRYEAIRAKHGVYEVEGDRASQEIAISSMELLTSNDDVERAIDIALLRSRLLLALGRYQEAEEIADRSAPMAAGPSFIAMRGQLTYLRAELARYLGRTEDAVGLAEIARALFAEVGDELRVAQTDDFAGGLAWESGDFEAAVELHGAAAKAFEAAGRVVEETQALNNMATAIFSIGDYSRAREIHRAGAERSREIGYRMGEGDHLDNMGGTAWAVGDLDLAEQFYTEALKIRQGMDDAWGTAISLGNLGLTQRSMGHPEQALALYREALEVDQRIGRRRGEAYDLHGIGLCHLDLGRFNLATESLQQGAGIREKLAENHLANESHVACALAMLRRGDVAPAVELAELALANEGDDFFEGAVETTATRLRCIEVVEVNSPEVARNLRRRTREGVLERAERISDPDQRRSYLERIDSHSKALAE